VVATGQAPAGLALDPLASRAWVALGGQDQLEVVDLLRAEPVGRIQLRAGDGPRSLLLLPDGRTLLVVNPRSRTAAFVDSVTTQELARAPVGEDPWSALVLPGANRAVVVNRHGSSLTVLDLASRQAVATVPTDAEPLEAAASRDGSRLYLIHRGSIHLAEYALPAVTPGRRIRVGLGASAVRVDPRTDLVYVAMDDGRVQVFDAGSGLPVDVFDLPAGATRLVIDDPQDQLLALMPSLRAVAVVDLTSRRLRAVIEVADGPYDLRLATERR